MAVSSATSWKAGRVRLLARDLAVLTGTRVMHGCDGAPHSWTGSSTRRDGQIREVHQRIVLRPHAHRPLRVPIVSHRQDLFSVVGNLELGLPTRDRDGVPRARFERRYLRVLDVAPPPVEQVMKRELAGLSADADQVAARALGVHLEEETGRGIDLPRPDPKADRGVQVAQHGPREIQVMEGDAVIALGLEEKPG